MCAYEAVLSTAISISRTEYQQNSKKTRFLTAQYKDTTVVPYTVQEMMRSLKGKIATHKEAIQVLYKDVRF
jgi:hypothetical protein